MASLKKLKLYFSYNKIQDIKNLWSSISTLSNLTDLQLNFQNNVIEELHFNDNFNSYSKELKNNIINGIVISGFLEGYK